MTVENITQTHINHRANEDLMRKTIASSLVLTGMVAGTLASPVAQASAAACSPKTEYIDTREVGGNDYGVIAWCETGEGYIRAKTTCVEEATFRRYTAIGPRVYSKKFHGNYMSAVWCRTGDAPTNKTYILG